MSDKTDVTDQTANLGNNGYIRVGEYYVTPQFRAAPDSAPTLSRLQPGAT